MTITRLHNGSYYISDIIEGHLIEQVYYFYTKKEAIKKFRQYRKQLKKWLLNMNIIIFVIVKYVNY